MKAKLLFITASLCLTSSVCFAQGIPSPAEIDERVKKALEDLDDTTTEIAEVLKLTYKAVPADPKKLAQMATGGSLPPGVDIDQVAKQYGPMIQATLAKHLRVAGTLEALQDLKVKSKKIPVGKHKFGFAFKGQNIVALVVYPEIDGKKKKPIIIKIKSKRIKAPQALKIELEEDSKKPERIKFKLAFLYQIGKSSGYFKKAK
jgi:hypothetical protein